MLAEFEKAVRGMKAGESKTFPWPSRGLPRQGRGWQEADFLVTLKHPKPSTCRKSAMLSPSRWPCLTGLRADIRRTSSTEVPPDGPQKAAALEALVKQAELDLPQSP